MSVLERSLILIVLPGIIFSNKSKPQIPSTLNSLPWNRWHMKPIHASWFLFLKSEVDESEGLRPQTIPFVWQYTNIHSRSLYCKTNTFKVSFLRKRHDMSSKLWEALWKHVNFDAVAKCQLSRWICGRRGSSLATTMLLVVDTCERRRGVAMSQGHKIRGTQTVSQHVCQKF